MRRPARRPLAALACLLSMGGACGLAGCEGVALVADAVQNGEPVEALYVLPDRPTAVLVDDTTNRLGPRATGQIATTAIHYLRANKALSKARFIEPREVARLESQLGRAWPTTPIDAIGRRLDAEQIIYARIISTSSKVAENLYRPEATLEVKVIQAKDAKRLWPHKGPIVDPKNPAPGYTLKIVLDYETRDSRYVGDATPDDISRRLADKAGLDLARLFYHWKLDPPGGRLGP